jgi:predicted MFS family arabinose efflux permease
MDLTEPSVRATQFAVFMAALNVGRAVGGVIAPGVVEAMGYAGLFLAAAGIQGLIAAVLGVLGGGHGVRGGTEG